MNQTTILWPIITMVALTAAVQVRMYLSRVREVEKKGLNLRAFTTRREAAANLEDTAAADNYSNLFELPVLFYVVCLALMLTGLVSMLQLALAWAFVASRIAHSTIHLTSNRVRHRFLAFVIGAAFVIVMWVVLAVSLLAR